MFSIEALKTDSLMLRSRANSQTFFLAYADSPDFRFPRVEVALKRGRCAGLVFCLCTSMRSPSLLRRKQIDSGRLHDRTYTAKRHRGQSRSRRPDVGWPYDVSSGSGDE